MLAKTARVPAVPIEDAVELTKAAAAGEYAAAALINTEKIVVDRLISGSCGTTADWVEGDAAVSAATKMRLEKQGGGKCKEC